MTCMDISSHVTDIVNCLRLWTYRLFKSLCRPRKKENLTHWGRVTLISVGNLTIICSDNGLSPVRRQAIIWTHAGILLIGPLVTNFSETSNKIYTFSIKKRHLKMSSGKWRPFCLGLNVLKLGITGPCEGNLLVTSEFHQQSVSNEESISLSLRHVQGPTLWCLINLPLRPSIWLFG